MQTEPLHVARVRSAPCPSPVRHALRVVCVFVFCFGFRVHGFMGLWVYGFMGLWVCGFMGLWVCGFVGCECRNVFRLCVQVSEAKAEIESVTKAPSTSSR